jgi:hypothetical protein
VTSNYAMKSAIDDVWDHEVSDEQFQKQISNQTERQLQTKLLVPGIFHIYLLQIFYIQLIFSFSCFVAFREGVDIGINENLQRGFDNGYRISIQIGYDWGILQGLIGYNNFVCTIIVRVSLDFSRFMEQILKAAKLPIDEHNQFVIEIDETSELLDKSCKYHAKLHTVDAIPIKSKSTQKLSNNNDNNDDDSDAMKQNNNILSLSEAKTIVRSLLLKLGVTQEKIDQLLVVEQT